MIAYRIVDKCITVLFVVFNTFALVSIPLGIYALLNSYVLCSDKGLINPHRITAISGIKLSDDIFWTFPEFFLRSLETRWWSKHREIYQALEIYEKNSKPVTIIEKSKTSKGFCVYVSHPTFTNILKKTSVFYIVALVWLISSWLIKRKYSKDESGKALSTFLASGSLYITSMTPLAERFITLPPVEFKLLIMLNYISGGGLISIIHFAMIFPKQKHIIEKHPWTRMIFYIYLFATTITYFFGMTAFDTSMPFFIIWSLLFFIAVFNSIRMEKNTFIKRQLQLILFAPLFMAGIFVFMHVIPQLMGLELMQPQFFACASLVLPFALPLSMDNITLYNTSMKLKEKIEKEYENLRQEVHDLTLRELIMINKKLENIKRKPRNSNTSEFISEINRLSSKISIASSSFRFLMKLSEKATNEDWDTWDDYVANLRYHIRRVVECFDLKISFKELSSNVNSVTIGSISLWVKLNLFLILNEAITNAIFHSGADKLEILLKQNNGHLIVEVKDNGVGFPNEIMKDGHYGIKNMFKRASEIGANIQMYNLNEGGACVKITIPLEKRKKAS